MKYASICSGIEAASMAWEPLGWQPVWFSEVAPFPSEVLAYRWPHIENLGDMTKLYEKETYHRTDFDVLVGGTPCQGFSLAGKRGGLDDERSQLVWHFLRILDEKRPRWMVWENVPGVLSSWSDAEAGEDGTVWQSNDFDQFTAALRQLGYGLAMRVLDAQYSDLAQRRERVFVVGYLGDWRPAAAVLFEQHSFGGHPAPGRGKGKETAATTENSIGATGETALTLLAKAGRRNNPTDENYVVNEIAGTLCHGGKSAGGVTSQDIGQGNIIIQKPLAAFSGERQTEVAACLTAKSGARSDLETETFLVEKTANCLTANAHKGGQSTAGNNPGMVNPVICFRQTQDNRLHDNGVVSGTLMAEATTSRQDLVASPAFCIQQNQVNANGSNVKEKTSFTLNANDVYYVSTLKLKVRRLTPREYERLMGFPDDHTRIPYRGKPAEQCPDGPRYAACGNSIAVPVLEWIGRRIQMVDKLKQTIHYE